MAIPSYSSLVLENLSRSIQESYLSELPLLARTARKTPAIHEETNRQIRVLSSRAVELCSSETLTPELRNRVNQDLTHLSRLAIDVKQATGKGFGAWLKDRKISERRDAKDRFNQISETVTGLFHSLEWIVEHRKELDKAEITLETQLTLHEKLPISIFISLAAEGNEQAKDHILLMATHGSEKAFEALKVLALMGNRWAVSIILDFWFRNEHAHLNRMESFIQTTPECLATLKQLADEGNILAQCCIIALSCESKSLRSYLKQNHHPWAVEAQKRIKRLKNWVKVLTFPVSPTRHWRTKEWESYPLEFRVKVIMAQILRENRLLSIVSGTTSTSILPPVSKCFPFTRSILVGVDDRYSSSEYTYLPKFLVSNLKAHGIEVVVGSPTHKISSTRQLTESPGQVWIQDTHSWCYDRSSVQLSCTALEPKAYGLSIGALRMRRAEEEIEDSFNQFDTIHVLGASRGSSQMQAIEFAYSRGIPFNIKIGFTEEGNTLRGTDDAGNSYVIIGKDTMAFVKSQIKHELESMGYKKIEGEWVIKNPENEYIPSEEISDEEIRRVLASDYGVSPEHLYFCEQPATYHLDTGMQLIGPKTVIINDSIRAADMMEAHLRNSSKRTLTVEEEALLTTFKEEAIRFKKAEDKAAADLKAQGFRVIRLEGRTYNPLARDPHSQQLNLFNCITLTAPDGQKVIIAIGCPKPFQDKFLQLFPGPGIKICFLDEKKGQERLANAGGPACMTQIIPTKL